jgi:hypothetical protein
MEGREKKSKLEATLETDVQDFLRTEERMDGRVTGFLNILYKVGKIKTLGDVPKLRDIDVFMVDQFSGVSLKKLNRLLNKYNIPPLKADMKKKNIMDYKRRADLERKRIVEEKGMENEYVLAVTGRGSFKYHPKKCLF